MLRYYFLPLLICLYFSALFVPHVPVVQAGTPDKTFNAETFTLDNGLQVVVVPNHRAAVVTQMVWYKVGAADEAVGTSGIAHFLEHLMFKGSEVIGDDPLPPGEFSKTVRSIGGQDNAFTSLDYTAYFQSFPVQHLERMMRMEAGRMRGMTLPPEEVRAERDVILEERRQRIDNDPRAQFNEHLMAMLYVNHPYATPVIGWAQEMATLTRDDAVSFYNTWYAPDNAILVLSGDVTVDTVKPLAEKIYGGIQVPENQASARRRVDTISPPLPGQVHMTFTDSTIRQPVVRKMIQGPSMTTNKHDALSLEIIADIMGGGPTSRLYKSLVVEQKLASNIGLSYAPYNRHGSTIWIYGVPLPDTKPHDLMDAIDLELQKLADHGVEAGELGDSIQRLQSDAIYARDSLSGPAMIIGRALATGGTLDDIEYWPRDIETITTDDLQKTAQRYLAPNTPDQPRSVTGFLLPRTEQPDNTQEGAD